jgi:hypothetical protein
MKGTVPLPSDEVPRTSPCGGLLCLPLQRESEEGVVEVRFVVEDRTPTKVSSGDSRRASGEACSWARAASGFTRHSSQRLARMRRRNRFITGEGVKKAAAPRREALGRRHASETGDGGRVGLRWKRQRLSARSRNSLGLQGTHHSEGAGRRPKNLFKSGVSAAFREIHPKGTRFAAPRLRFAPLGMTPVQKGLLETALEAILISDLTGPRRPDRCCV